MRNRRTVTLELDLDVLEDLLGREAARNPSAAINGALALKAEMLEFNDQGQYYVFDRKNNEVVLLREPSRPGKSAT